MRNVNILIMLFLAIVLILPKESPAQQQSGLDWSSFDFVPGDEIIFEDNQQGERNGEFPGKWDLVNGTVENAVLDGENVIMFINTNNNSYGGIAPLMASGDEDYLPDEFTVEFDAFFERHNRGYRVLFYDGKIVTTGIRFDVNQASLKPESFGVINEIVNLMKENPDLNFSVEGHTDSDGSASHNQTLSEARAKAVMDEMIKLGISPTRLTSVGHGQSVPMAGNDTPEGKAQNRRVEFVKIDDGMIKPVINAETTTTEAIATEPVTSEHIATVPVATELQSYTMKVLGTIDQGDLVYTINISVWHDVAADKRAAEIHYLLVNSRGESFPSKFMEIIDGDLKYNIDFQENSGRTGPKSKSDIEDFENVKSPDEAAFRQLIESRGGTFLGRETFSGYNCLVFVQGTGEYERKTWYYKGLPLKVEAHKTVVEVTSLEENVSIPAERFQIPAGISIR